MPDPTLRDELARVFADWHTNLSSQWTTFFAAISPALDAVDPLLVLDHGRFVFPGSKASRPTGAPPGSHALRPFETVTPAAVRVLVIGQDPYFDVGQATGRSFEQGDLVDWRTKRPTASIRRLIQAVAQFRRPPGSAYLVEKGGWDAVAKDVESLALEPPTSLWNRWEKAGVMFVNAAFTISSRDKNLAPEAEKQRQQLFRMNGHAPFWRPVLNGLIVGLANRTNTPLVVVTWGNDAKQTVKDSGMQAAAGTRWQTEVRQVSRVHPSNMPTIKGAPRFPFLDGKNPLVEVNDALEAAGASPISW